MARYISVYKEVEVDVALDKFDTAELVTELEARGAGTFDLSDGCQVLNTIYEKRRSGKDYQTELNQLIWLALGRIV